MKKTLRCFFVIISLLLVVNQTYVYADRLIKVNNSNTTISKEEYQERRAKYYAAYKNGVIPKNKIPLAGWKLIYEYELEQEYIYIEDVPQWAIDAYDIDLSIGEREPQFYRYIPLLLLVIPFIYYRSWKRNKEVN